MIKGQVSSMLQATEIKPGLNLIGYAIPAAITLNDSGINWTGAFSTNGLTQTSDKILVIGTDGSFTQYFYFTKPASFGSAYDSLNGKWITEDYAVADVTIPAGHGFWYDRRTNTVFTFQPNL